MSRLLRTSYHEAGHALVALHCGLKVFQCSIVPDSENDGHTYWQSFENEDSILVMLGGASGESLAQYTDPFLPGSGVDPNNPIGLSRGAEGDIEQVTDLLRKLHPRVHDIERVVDAYLETTDHILESNRPALDALAARLRENKTLGAAELEQWWRERVQAAAAGGSH